MCYQKIIALKVNINQEKERTAADFYHFMNSGEFLKY